MLIQAIAGAFKYKLVTSVIVLACWRPSDRVKFYKELTRYGLLSTFACEPSILHFNNNRAQGVLLMDGEDYNLQKIKSEYFAVWYKWIVVDKNVPRHIKNLRYDSDMLLIHPPENSTQNDPGKNKDENRIIYINDVYYHPKEGVSSHLWGCWTANGLEILYEKERIQRRHNLNKYPLKIATPTGSYSGDTYKGSFQEYITDMSISERDSGIRIGYNTCVLITEILNATDVLVPTMLWSTEVNNNSMMIELKHGTSELGGGILRMMNERTKNLDYIMSIWLVRVGFTYLAERGSSKNMFLEPFTSNVWWCCLGLFIILTLARRATSKTKCEKEGVYIDVLATTLQQDASAVPEGISGRWTFLVVSVFAMLIHGYYTSLIVSAFMNSERSGPNTLQALGDSKYTIASEEYDYIKYLMFDVKTNRDDLEYLKKKKLTGKFYQDIQVGVQLIRSGTTAFHSEFNQLYPYLRTLTDAEICKLKYIDTIPEIPAWVTTNKRAQWTPTFRIAGARLREVGLSKRLVSRFQKKPPECRVALLAERVNLADIAPILIFYIVAAMISAVILVIEILSTKWKNIVSFIRYYYKNRL